MLKRFAKKIAGMATGSGKSSSSSSKLDKSAVKTQEKKAEPRSEPLKKRKDSGSPRRADSRQRKKRKRWSPSDFQVESKEGEMRFHDFDLPEPLMHAISDLGFKYCTPIQARVLAHLGEGRNIAGRAQTGTGKTAAFLISIFTEFWNRKYGLNRLQMGKPRALVLAPTRELCLQIVKDAEDLAKYCRFRCLAVYGGKNFDKQRKELTEKPVELVAATPGRLLDCLNRRLINLKQIDTLVIDEADRMLDMGFIPDVKRIVRATPPKDKRQTFLFSATLTDQVLRLAEQWAPDPVFCEVDPEQVEVNTVQQIVYTVQSHSKFTLLNNILKEYKDKRVLIFGNRRTSTKRLHQKLIDQGFNAAYLAGSVDQDRRVKVLENFRSGKVKIVVATDVAGRGIHVDDIALVLNYDFPYEAEDYVHRIGRTGRACEEGTAISFACEHESFVIPEIEAYIGHELNCTVPDERLLDPVENRR
ncbi:MAG: DEAD/DEAH box helicase [Verrucomicrobiota bacterium]